MHRMRQSIIITRHDEHEHHHDHDEHEHHHDHDDHEHHHDHDEHEHHHEHGEGCTCGCHDHDHEHGLIIMLMMYLQAGARRHLTNLSALSSKKSLSSLWKMTRFFVQRAW